MVQCPICFFTSVPSTFVHSFNFFITAARALVLLCTRDRDERIYLLPKHPLAFLSFLFMSSFIPGLVEVQLRLVVAPAHLPLGVGKELACHVEEGKHPIVRVEVFVACREDVELDTRAACLDRLEDRANMEDRLD
jgi:hypothetical protein